jgi:hypothetical protein
VVAVKVRLSGTRAECDLLVGRLPELLAGVVEVVEVSSFYPNRGVGVLGRVYVDLLFTAPVDPVAERGTS